MRVKTEAKREAILDAASKVFLEAGFDGASMAEIAKMVGGSKATLYSYFKSKEELFVDVMHRAAHQQLDPLVDALSQDNDNLPMALQTFGEQVLGFLCSAPTIQSRRVVVAESGRSDIGRRFHEQGPREGMQKVAEFLARQMELGKLRPSDPLLAAQQLAALLECETVIPLLLGIETEMPPDRIREAVKRALQTFLGAYGSTACEAAGGATDPTAEQA